MTRVSETRAADSLGTVAAPKDGFLVDQIRRMVGLVPDERAFVDLDAGRALTFREWHSASNRLARGLAARGLSKGDRVALYLPTSDALAFVVAYAAIHKAGGVAVPTNTRLTSREVRHVLAHAEITGAVTSPVFAEQFGHAREELDSLKFSVVTGPAGPEAPGAGDVAWDDAFDEDDADFQVPLDAANLADIMYTSGTTGLPKGVAVTHNNVAMIPNSEPQWTGNGWIHSSPLFTFAGIGFIYNPMKMGMVSLYQAKFDAGRWIEYVERERPPFAFIVPAMAQLIADHERFAPVEDGGADLSSLQLVSVGSAPLPFEVLRRVQERIPNASVSNSYGMTEAGAAYCVMPPGESLKRKGSVGLPLPPAELRIVDEDGNMLSGEEEGELFIRTPGKQRAYYRDPEATAAAWEDDGWLHTGDLAKFDPDGYLYIVGRKKDVIIRGGHNIHAGDVEAVLYEHPAVLEAAVFGVPHPVLGEDVAAAVVLRPAARMQPVDLVNFCDDRLADYKVPRKLAFVTELPRNATGKVVKRELLAQYHGPPDEGASD